MDKYGTNVTAVRACGGVCGEVHLTLKCGCEYLAGAHSIGKGFELFCEDHGREADQRHLEMCDLIHRRDALLVTEADALPQVRNANLRIRELTIATDKFYNGILGRPM